MGFIRPNNKQDYALLKKFWFRVSNHSESDNEEESPSKDEKVKV